MNFVNVASIASLSLRFLGDTQFFCELYLNRSNSVQIFCLKSFVFYQTVKLEFSLKLVYFS